MATSSSAPQVVPLSKSQVLGLLTELLAGYASDSFQQQLQELAKNNCAKNGNDHLCLEGRLALTLAVQKEVLPRYGFAGDEDGVLAMKMAVRKHMGDPRVARKSMDIRDKLLLPELRKEAPVAPAVKQLVAESPAIPVQVIAAPAQSPAAAAQAPVARPKRAECDMAIKKGFEMEVMVQHAKGQGQLVVKVAAEGATMLKVKEAVVEALGRGTVADVQLVMWGGGMFVNHRDCDEVMNDRVFATGLDLRGVN